ncbi:hypothetical protein FB451DRAFT_1173390 [Mycena latifolia]|nr:hypothetical protein FB451DRAFT_1173390 [Mycena latifolia]
MIGAVARKNPDPVYMIYCDWVPRLSHGYVPSGVPSGYRGSGVYSMYDYKLDRRIECNLHPMSVRKKFLKNKTGSTDARPEWLPSLVQRRSRSSFQPAWAQGADATSCPHTDLIHTLMFRNSFDFSARRYPVTDTDPDTTSDWSSLALAGVCSFAVAAAVASFPLAHMAVVIDGAVYMVNQNETAAARQLSPFRRRHAVGVIKRTLGNVYAASALRVFIH